MRTHPHARFMVVCAILCLGPLDFGPLDFGPLSIGLGRANAQSQPITLEVALAQAYSNGPELATSQATLRNAQADLKAKESDPSTLILTLTQARNAVELELARLQARKVDVMSNVITAYLNLFEAQENINVLEAQAAFDARNLEAAKVKLELRNGTALDVSKAENSLASSKQSLIDARLQLPILSNKLEPLLGLPLTASLRASAPPSFQETKFDPGSFETVLDQRSAVVLQAAQAVEIAQLNVQLSDNDFTPPATLRDAKTNLENAQRALVTARKNAITQIRDANRNRLNSLERVRLTQKDLDNAETALAQERTKFKNGTSTKLQLQQAEVAFLRAKYNYTQAINTYWRALAQLSTSADTDMTGMLARVAKK
jgi:outer membrane protein